MVFKNQPNKERIVMLNKDSDKDWHDFYALSRQVMPGVFNYYYIACQSRGFKKVHKKDQILLLETENGLRVGAALVNERKLGTTAAQYKVLYLNFLMIYGYERGHGYGTTLLNGVIEYAKNNGYDYVELTNNVNKIFLQHNVYEKNGFNKVRIEESAFDFVVTLQFRIDTNQHYVNLGNAIYKTYLEAAQLENTSVNERIIINKLQQNYVDIISPTKPLTKADIEELKKSPELIGGVVGIKDLLTNKNITPEIVANNFRMQKMLKSVKALKKPISFYENNGITFEINDLETLNRTFTVVNDKVSNQQLTKIAMERLNKK